MSDYFIVLRLEGAKDWKDASKAAEGISDAAQCPIVTVEEVGKELDNEGQAAIYTEVYPFGLLDE